MVHIIPPYRTYQAACREKNYKASVMEGVSGVEWVAITDKRTGNTNLLRIPEGISLNTPEIPEHLRMQFTGELVSDMIDKFI